MHKADFDRIRAANEALLANATQAGFHHPDHAHHAHRAELAAAAAAAAGAAAAAADDFDRWAAEHGKVYRDAAHRVQARRNFWETDREIARHNRVVQQRRKESGNGPRFVGWTKGHGPFSDLSDDEFRRRVHVQFRGGSALPSSWAHPPPSSAAASAFSPSPHGNTVPPSLDWSAQGKVSPVRNQGHCGSCWAFGVVGAVESAYAIAATKAVEPLSPQDLLSCFSAGSAIAPEKGAFNCGCSGGDPDKAMVWISEHGIESWATRPYTNVTAACDGMSDLSPANCDCGEAGEPACPASPKCPDACNATARDPVVTVSGFQKIDGPENSTVIAAVAEGPLAALVDCEAPLFKNYKAGIIGANPGDQCEGIHNHVVLIVGWGEEHGVPYWRVKNSFGASWGEAGYVRIVRDRLMCGLGGEQYAPVGARAWKKRRRAQQWRRRPGPPAEQGTHTTTEAHSASGAGVVRQ